MYCNGFGIGALTSKKIYIHIHIYIYIYDAGSWGMLHSKYSEQAYGVVSAPIQFLYQGSF